MFLNFFRDIKEDFISHRRNAKGITSIIVTLAFSRGFHVLLSHRVQILFLKIPIVGKFLSRILWYITSFITSNHISIYAKIQGGVYIPHPTGIVIGKNVVIKKNVSIYQGVTLGKKSDLDISVPTVHENVYLGAGSKIIGNVVINKNAIVGANSVLLIDVPEGQIAVGIPAKIIIKREDIYS